MLADLYDKKQLSLYQPPSDVQEVTKYAKESYGRGREILTKAWPELNDLSIIDRDNRDKKTFNSYVDESNDDPYTAWEWRGTRSMARNKALEMHAHLTAGFLFPMVSAQDENNDEDKGVGEFMKDMLVWMGDNSNYKTSFLQMVMGLLTSPVTYMGAEYARVMQKIKEKTDKGYTTKEVLDEELSGFRAPVYGASEVLITNAYVQNIQNQTCIVKQKYLDYADAQKKYGNHENWEFVQRGINSVFDETDGLFYDVFDIDNPNTVKETIFEWRGEDLALPFLGGVYMGMENVNWNPIKHRDNFNQPKYDVIPFGYYRINEHFFYYKSLCNSLFWDDQLIDAMYENVMNREFLDLRPPTVTSGDDQINTSVVFPGANIVSAKPDFQVKPILPPSNANKYGALQYIEESIKEASISDTLAGQLPEATQKAFSVNRAEQNARTILKGVGQSLGESIVQYGKLMVDIAVNHLSTAEIQEISAEARSIKYRQFVLPKQVSGGRSVTKVLKYDKDLIGKEMTKSQKEDYEMKLYMETGNEKVIIAVNPEVAARMKYLIKYDPEELFAENRQYMQTLLSQLYPLLRQDPLINAETLLRKLLYSFFRTESDELITDKGDIQQMLGEMQQPKLPNQLSQPNLALQRS